MQDHNRNLSSIIWTIQNEAPAPGESKGSSANIQEGENTAGFVEAETSDSIWAGRQRSAWRSFFYVILATLVLVAAYIFVLGGRSGEVSDHAYEVGQNMPKPATPAEHAISNSPASAAPVVAGGPAVPAVAVEQDVNFSNQEIHARQSIILQQLEQLTLAIADIKTGNDQHWNDSLVELKRIEDDFQHKVDTVAAAVAGLQTGSSAQVGSAVPDVKGSSDAGAKQMNANGVPASGKWVVNVANSGQLESIEKLMDKLHKRGIPAETQEVHSGGKTRYRLRIPGFSSSAEARDYARDLDDDLGLKDPWVSRR